jgi:hypothetical protein
MSWLFAKEAEPEEQGSFCDTTSGIHYDHATTEAALNQAAVFQEHNEGADVEDLKDSNAENCNTAILETDAQGFASPARYKPGN